MKCPEAEKSHSYFLISRNFIDDFVLTLPTLAPVSGLNSCGLLAVAFENELSCGLGLGRYAASAR